MAAGGNLEAAGGGFREGEEGNGGIGRGRDGEYRGKLKGRGEVGELACVPTLEKFVIVISLGLDPQDCQLGSFCSMPHYGA